ncbi:MAG: metallophosphoesterase [Candidatus Thermoplasmatota archaeon]|nr:metallophosphoesterase [Candidatus Thermoplasmatota archaeon]
MRIRFSHIVVCITLVLFLNAFYIPHASAPTPKAATTLNINWPIWAMPATRAKGSYFILNVSSDASASSVWNVTVSTEYDSYELPVTAVSSPATNIWELNITVPTELRTDLYNLTVTVDGISDSEPHAISVVNALKDKFTIIQLTDTHIGSLSGGSTYKDLANVLRELNLIKPELVIVTGDCCDKEPTWWSDQEFPANEQDQKFREVMLSLKVPVYIVNGNHDYDYSGDSSIEDFRKWINPYSDICFTYGNYRFIGLDSGRYVNLINSNGQGLRNDQIAWLEYVLNRYNDSTQKFVFMHHPPHCIEQNSALYKELMIKYNVSLSIHGHTHSDTVYDKNYNKIPEDGSIGSLGNPAFIETRSTTKGTDNGYRIIRVNGTKLDFYTYDLDGNGIRDDTSSTPTGLLTYGYTPSNNGTAEIVTAWIINNLREDFENAFLAFTMPKPAPGYSYICENGWIEQKISLATVDVYYVRTNISAISSKEVVLRPVSACDVGVEAINSPIENGTYYAGPQEIVATIKNYGESASNFNVSCEARKIIKNETEQVVFSDDSEGYESGSRGDWWLYESTTRTVGDWEHGTPSTVGPSSAHSGSYCWGTNLQGNYRDYSHYEFAGELHDGGVLSDIYGKNEFYDVPAQEGDLIEITVTWASGSKNDIDLYLYTPYDSQAHNIEYGDVPSGGYAVARARSAADGSEILTYTVPKQASGMYRLRVFAYPSTGNQYSYDISVKVDNRAINYPARLGYVDGDDDDLPKEAHHAFYARAGEKISIRYTFSQIGGSNPDVDLYLYDPQNNRILMNEADNDGEWYGSVTTTTSGYHRLKMASKEYTQKYNCFVNVSGPQHAYLISPYIDLSNTSYPHAELTFWHWYHTEYWYDYCYVYVWYNATNNWVKLAEHTGNNSQWTFESLSLDQCIGYNDVRICFILSSDWCTNYAGWYIDDIAVKLIIPPEELTADAQNRTISALGSGASTQLSWDINLEEGIYKIIIKTWLTGDSYKYNNEKTVKIFIKNATFTIELVPGWNFISLVYNTSYRRAEDLAQAIDYCVCVKRWNSSAQSFETHKRGTNENNFTIDAGVGYWVYLTNPSSFTFNGSRFAALKMDLNPGWNSIGRFNLTTTDAKTLAQNIPNCNALAYWDSGLGRFVVWLVGTNVSNFDIEPGKGYMVYVMQATAWTNN